MLLSDGYLANGTEPWKLPDIDSLPPIDIEFAANSTVSTVRGVRSTGPMSATTTSLVRGRSRAPKR